MGNFECNSIEDLVFSSSFREWVLTGDTSESGFWENWIAGHPEKREIVQHSKALIFALQLNLRQLSEEETENEIRRVLGKLRESPDGDEGFLYTPDRRRRPLGRGIRMILSGAAVLTVIGLGWWAFRHYLNNEQPAYEAFKASHSDGSRPLLQIAAGTTGEPRTIDLPDGSRVSLTANSKLYYASDLGTARGNREVYLTGEAFFEIRKNAIRPFYVYTNSVITKVLGTSFRVEAWPTASRTMVAVRTGKVSVYRKDDFYQANMHGAESGGVILTPNQELVYDQEKNELNKILTDKPEKVNPIQSNAFVFDGTPVSKVFRTLQEVYQIPIVYDEEILSGCSLSASMGNETFYEKLNIICRAINASYEVIDGNIIITATGCK